METVDCIILKVPVHMYMCQNDFVLFNKFYRLSLFHTQTDEEEDNGQAIPVSLERCSCEVMSCVPSLHPSCVVCLIL